MGSHINHIKMYTKFTIFTSYNLFYNMYNFQHFKFDLHFSVSNMGSHNFIACFFIHRANLMPSFTELPSDPAILYSIVDAQLIFCLSATSQKTQ
jgi:hypothetical protein